LYCTGHRENILKTAKALVEDTKTLVAGAASSQEQLAVAAQNAVTTIVQLSDVVKAGAASLGSQNQEAQVGQILKKIIGFIQSLIIGAQNHTSRKIKTHKNHLKF